MVLHSSLPPTSKTLNFSPVETLPIKSTSTYPLPPAPGHQPLFPSQNLPTLETSRKWRGIQYLSFCDCLFHSFFKNILFHSYFPSLPGKDYSTYSCFSLRLLRKFALSLLSCMIFAFLPYWRKIPIRGNDRWKFIYF